jgi:hypothetical protein
MQAVSDESGVNSWVNTEEYVSLYLQDYCWTLMGTDFKFVPIKHLYLDRIYL